MVIITGLTDILLLLFIFPDFLCPIYFIVAGPELFENVEGRGGKFWEDGQKWAQITCQGASGSEATRICTLRGMCALSMPARKVKSTNRELSTMVTHRAITIVLDTGAQYTMVGMRGWYIIKCHAMWIDSQGVNMGDSSKAGCRLQLLDARGVVKNYLYRKR